MLLNQLIEGRGLNELTPDGKIELKDKAKAKLKAELDALYGCFIDGIILDSEEKSTTTHAERCCQELCFDQVQAFDWKQWHDGLNHIQQIVEEMIEFPMLNHQGRMLCRGCYNHGDFPRYDLVENRHVIDEHIENALSVNRHDIQHIAFKCVLKAFDDMPEIIVLEPGEEAKEMN